MIVDNKSYFKDSSASEFTMLKSFTGADFTARGLKRTPILDSSMQLKTALILHNFMFLLKSLSDVNFSEYYSIENRPKKFCGY